MAWLAVSVALSLATTTLLAYAGVLVLRRSASDEARLALRMFATWWFSVAAVIFLAGSHTLLAILGVRDIALHTALVYAGAVPLAAALWGLLYYLVFIYTGRRSAIWPLTLAYVGFLAFELYYFASFGDRRLEETIWNVRVVGDAFPPTWIGMTFAALLAAPVLFVVAAYGLLLLRTLDPAHRYRLRLITFAFAQWFGVVLVGYALGWDRAEWFPIVYEAPGVLASLLVVAAYRPPRWVERHLAATPS